MKKELTKTLRKVDIEGHNVKMARTDQFITVLRR